MRFEPGSEFGKFRILGELGRGGMAVVYEAEQTDLHRRVAIKIVPEGGEGEGFVRERLQREAEAGARLQHPNIVQVYETGLIDNHRYISMELVAGRSLAQRIRERKADRDARLAAYEKGDTDDEHRRAERHALTATTDREYIEWAVRKVIDVLRAIDYAHERGVLHRDIKPQNLLLSETGRIMIADFGLARLADHPAMSRAGEMHGTPWYMSPEQIEAGRVRIDHRTDIFSTGVVLYEMLALRRPFRGDGLSDVFDEILHKEPVPLRRLNPRLPRDLETIVHHAMEKEPARRYPTARAFAEDLERFLNREDVLARPVGWWGHWTRKAARHKPLVGVTTALLLVILVWGVHEALDRGRRAREAARLVAQAEALEASGALDDAERKLREVLRHLRPSDRSVRAELGRVQALRAAEATRLLADAERLVDEQRYDRARVVLERLRRMDPGNARARELADLTAGLRSVNLLVLGGPCRVVIRPYVQSQHRWDAPAVDAVTGDDGRLRVDLTAGDYLVTARDDQGRFGEAWLPVDVMIRVDPLVIYPRRDDECEDAMALLPAGSYLIGEDSLDNLGASPSRRVELPDYRIDLAEVSNRDFDRYLDALRALELPLPGRPQPAWDGNELRETYADLPYVARWLDLNALLAFFGKRLPTEIEWEAAVRGADGRIYAYGNAFDTARANVGRDPYTPAFEPVRARGGEEAGWAHGLFQSTGNAREWTADRYLPYVGFHTPPPDERLDVPIPVFERRHRVARGGYFGEQALLARATFRLGIRPDLPWFTGARGVRRRW